jgi:hypothetical protein
MTEVAAVPEKRKWVREYQPKDEHGLPVGPPQRFEADTQQELIDKLAAAHENASVKLYQTKKAVKLGTMLEPDKDEPIQTFEERPLTADERVKVGKLLNDPNTQADALKILLEAQFGAPVESVRQVLREAEIDKRVKRIRECIAEFKLAHPEYVESELNRDTMTKYLDKHNMPYTKKNLEIAFEDLTQDGLLTLKAPKAEVPKPASGDPAPNAAAPAGTETIPPPSTNAPAIPVEPTEVRPKQSSSGLGRENSSAAPVSGAPKVTGITIREINSMTSDQYAKALRDGIPARNITAAEFAKAIQDLYKK